MRQLLEVIQGADLATLTVEAQNMIKWVVSPAVLRSRTRSCLIQIRVRTAKLDPDPGLANEETFLV
jgi:hypothetical protein